MNRLLYLICLAGIGVLSLAAHDFWIEPSSYQPAVGSKVAIRFRVGERFRGDPVPRDPRRIITFSHFSPASEDPVAGVPGLDPAGIVTVRDRGLHWVVYQSTPSFVELDAEAFEKYLREEGLESVIEERSRRDEGSARGRELYSRCVKSLLRVGNHQRETGFDRVLNFPVELVPAVNPYGVRPGGEIELRVLRQGRPLVGALVTAHPHEEPRRPIRQRSNGDGRVKFRLDETGPWLFKTVHMERAPDGEEADWRSWWASLTFELRTD